MLEDKSNSLHGIGLTKRVFIHGMRKCLGTQFAIGRQQILYIQIAKEWTIAQVIISIAKIAIDYKLIDWMYLEISFIFLTSCLAFSIGSEIKAHREYIGQFAQP